jgi:hypothetical protein
MYQLDFFVGILLLTEVVIILVMLLLLFNVFATGVTNSRFRNLLSSFGFQTLLFSMLLTLTVTSFSLCDDVVLEQFLFTVVHWDDFYESLVNNNITDFYGLYLSFYFYNSFIFIFFGFILFFGSVACVNLNLFFKKNKIAQYCAYFDIYSFLGNVVDVFFFKKQNLISQETVVVGTRIFSKKK